MKNMYLSLVAVGLTAICVTYMISSSKMVEHETATVKATERKAAENIKKDTQAKQKLSNSQERKESSGANAQTNQQSSAQVKPTAAKANANAAPAYPIYESDIKGQLSQNEKESILNIATRLAPLEYSLVNEYLQKGDNESLIRVIRLLNLRLGDKDFLRVREITASSIDYDAVDKRMKR